MLIRPWFSLFFLSFYHLVPLLLLFIHLPTSSSIDSTIFNLITKYQHPEPHLCSKKRLLIIHSDGKNFEGTGSIIKALMFGLSEAYYTNRTLIWGRFIPDLYTRTPQISCYDPNQGGLFNCFYQKLSSCSINDVSKSELYDLSVNGYDDTKRVLLQQPRRGLTAYIPPKEYRNYPDIRLLWPASFAAYVFRLKFTPSSPPSQPLSCAHVRHGDIKALSYVYRNKGIYEFEDYYHALRTISPIQSKNIYIASDSYQTEEKIQWMREMWLKEETEKICQQQKTLKSNEITRNDDDDDDDDVNEEKSKFQQFHQKTATQQPSTTSLRSAQQGKTSASSKESSVSSSQKTPKKSLRANVVTEKEEEDDEEEDDDDRKNFEQWKAYTQKQKPQQQKHSVEEKVFKKKNENKKKKTDKLFDDDDILFNPDIDIETGEKNMKNNIDFSSESWSDELVFDEDDELPEEILDEVVQRIKENYEDDDDDEEDEEEEELEDQNERNIKNDVDSSHTSSDSNDPTSADADPPSCIPKTPIIIPNILTEKRFRSEFGSHVAATRGGCVENSCSFPYQHIPRIIQDRQHSTVEKDVYNVVKDSIEDIHILSHCSNGFIGQASSHLSTVSVLLLIYRYFQTPETTTSTTSGSKITTQSFTKNKFLIKYLDEIGISNGQYESSYLLGTYNAQEYVPPEQGYERFASLEMRFGDISPIPPIKPNLTCDKDLYLFPTIPYNIFDMIISSWTHVKYSHPICSNERTDLQELINYGVELSTWHPNDALQCWYHALNKLEEISDTLDPLVEEVVRENIAAIKEKHFKRYMTAIRKK